MSNSVIVRIEKLENMAHLILDEAVMLKKELSGGSDSSISKQKKTISKDVIGRRMRNIKKQK